MSADTPKTFEAWRETQHWYKLSKPDPDDPEDDGATHRLMNIAAIEAWTASRSQALEEAAQMADKLKPAGGRAWSESQAACFAALDELAAAIRKLGAQG
jgi:hypothetical protein